MLAQVHTYTYIYLYGTAIVALLIPIMPCFLPAAFKDNSAAFTAKGYSIYGMSADQPDVQAGWKKEHGLNYTLLCDTDKKVRAYAGMRVRCVLCNILNVAVQHLANE